MTEYIRVTEAIHLIAEVIRETPHYPPHHALEGTACHTVCLNWLAHHHHLTIDAPTTPLWPGPDQHPSESDWQEVLAAALLAFQEFCEKYEVEVLAIEPETTSNLYGWVGHPDLVCTLKWRGRRVKAIVDLKFVVHVLWTHRLQVRMYSCLDGLKDATIGILFICNRTTGIWTIEPVNLTEGLEDLMAASCGTQLVRWAEQKGFRTS